MTNSRAGIPAPRRQGRRGFSLVETLVGMTLLSIAIISVARLDYNVMRRTLDVSRLSYGNATMLRQVNRFVALNYDSLAAHAGCVTITTGPTPNTACATVTTPSSGVKQVTIIRTLTGVTGSRPDTVIVQRTSASGNNPFNTP
jgi:prepilin-type N-terminal cleavage/methylation domain-containing protein